MRIVAVSTLKLFRQQAAYRDAEQPLRTWNKVAKAAKWQNPPEVRATFDSADILKGGRIIFDIGGNKYRLVAQINYGHSVVYIRFVGTHRQYDQIDAQTIWERNIMELRPIRTDEDYRAALAEASLLMATEAGTPEGDRLDVLATLIEAYEAARYPVDAPDPIAAIQFMMEQKGLQRRDLEPAIGGRGRVSEILSRKRPLTLPMIRALAPLLDLPADVLIKDYPTASAA